LTASWATTKGTFHRHRGQRPNSPKLATDRVPDIPEAFTLGICTVWGRELPGKFQQLGPNPPWISASSCPSQKATGPFPPVLSAPGEAGCRSARQDAFGGLTGAGHLNWRRRAWIGTAQAAPAASRLDKTLAIERNIDLALGSGLAIPSGLAVVATSTTATRTLDWATPGRDGPCGSVDSILSARECRQQRAFRFRTRKGAVIDLVSAEKQLAGNPNRFSNRQPRWRCGATTRTVFDQRRRGDGGRFNFSSHWACLKHQFGDSPNRGCRRGAPELKLVKGAWSQSRRNSGNVV